jgi:hypothetical protein
MLRLAAPVLVYLVVLLTTFVRLPGAGETDMGASPAADLTLQRGRFRRRGARKDAGPIDRLVDRKPAHLG